MGLLFNRNIRVTFGQPGTIGTGVSGLYVQATGQKSSEPDPNKTTINIFNLNETSRAALQEEGALLRLEAGYGNNLEQLFIGDVSKAKSEKQGPNIVTMIEIGDGRKQYNEASINLSLAPGATHRQVVEALAKALNLGVGTIKGLTEGVFQNAIVLSGPVRDRLDDITDKMGVEWSIQDNNLQILPGDVFSEQLGILLTPQTGLLGSPAKREDGVEFRALLRAEFKPGKAVEIRSDKFRGLVKIRKVDFDIDNRSGPFEVRCEGKDLGSVFDLVNQNLNISTPDVARLA